MKENIIFIILLILLTDICDTVSQLLLKYSINSLDLHVNSVKKVLHLVAQLLKTPREQLQKKQHPITNQAVSRFLI